MKKFILAVLFFFSASSFAELTCMNSNGENVTGSPMASCESRATQFGYIVDDLLNTGQLKNGYPIYSCMGYLSHQGPSGRTKIATIECSGNCPTGQEFNLTSNKCEMTAEYCQQQGDKVHTVTGEPGQSLDEAFNWSDVSGAIYKDPVTGCNYEISKDDTKHPDLDGLGNNCAQDVSGVWSCQFSVEPTMQTGTEEGKTDINESTAPIVKEQSSVSNPDGSVTDTEKTVSSDQSGTTTTVEKETVTNADGSKTQTTTKTTCLASGVCKTTVNRETFDSSGASTGNAKISDTTTVSDPMSSEEMTKEEPTPPTATASGSCDVAPACDGDPVGCALLAQQHMEMCQLEKEAKGASAEFTAMYGAQKLGDGSTFAPDHGEINAADFTSSMQTVADPHAAVCPAPLQLVLMGRSYEVSFENFCYLADALGTLIVLLAMFLAARIFLAGVVK